MLAPNGNKKTKPRVNGITGIETRRTSNLAQQLSYKYYTLQRHHRDRQKKKDTKISPTTAVVFRRGGADLPGQPNVLQGRMRRLNLANFCRLGLAVKTETGAGGGGGRIQGSRSRQQLKGIWPNFRWRDRDRDREKREGNIQTAIVFLRQLAQRYIYIYKR